MCLAFPAKVLEIDGDLATVERSGVKRAASLILLPERNSSRLKNFRKQKTFCGESYHRRFFA
ncbi:MAG: HypC/HybG/HupF family hydrogenase formation chaperone [Selenomonadaceae bacterium]|nr:HypC/HybG/HupF family hydrogenase formation chaperone [Selenomonadaceae bacterium]MBQ7493054.1 HypC/HybG/HupF family hydrogenase formation chaperone [Selenomonadaceae bacterium]